MELRIYQVDAFADAVFRGNPASICPLESWLPDETMQAIAAATLDPFDSSVTELGSYLSLLEAGARRGGFSSPPDVPMTEARSFFEEVADSVGGDWRSW